MLNPYWSNTKIFLSVLVVFGKSFVFTKMSKISKIVLPYFGDSVAGWSSRMFQSQAHTEIFRDWKFYPQESREVSRENLWALSRLDLPPANKLPYWVARNIKNPNFEKYYKYFSRLGHWPVSESRKIYVWAHDWNMWLDQPATESPK